MQGKCLTLCTIAPAPIYVICCHFISWKENRTVSKEISLSRPPGYQHGSLMAWMILRQILILNTIS